MGSDPSGDSQGRALDEAESRKNLGEFAFLIFLTCFFIINIIRENEEERLLLE